MSRLRPCILFFSCLGLVTTVLCCPKNVAAQTAYFFDLGAYFSPTGGGGPGSFEPINVSDDGSTVFGQWQDSSSTVFRWRPFTDPEVLFAVEAFPASSGFSTSGISDVASDGSAFVSHWLNAQPSPSSDEPFRWTEKTGPVGLGSLSPGSVLTSTTYASGMSGDGKMIVGLTNDGAGQSGKFTWTTDSGLQPYTDAGFPRDLNFDGSVAVGTLANAATLFLGGGTTQTIGPAGSFGVELTSDTATALVEQGQNYSVWTESNGAVTIVPMTDSQYMRFTQLSDDGSIAGGACRTSAAPLQACMWDQDNGSYFLTDRLISEYGLGAELANYQLEDIHGISADGTVIVGIGRNVDLSMPTIWAVVIVPEPTAIAYALLVAAVVVGKTSRSSLYSA